MGRADVRGGQGVARYEEVSAQDDLAGERGGYAGSRGTEHKATSYVLGQRTEEVVAGRGHAASVADPLLGGRTPPKEPSRRGEPQYPSRVFQRAGVFSEVPVLEGQDSTREPRCLACLRALTKGRTQRGRHH